MKTHSPDIHAWNPCRARAQRRGVPGTSTMASSSIKASAALAAIFLLVLTPPERTLAETLERTFDEQDEQLVMRLSFPLPSYSLVERDGWSVLEWTEPVLHVPNAPGKPDLPFARRLLAIPGDATVEEVSVRSQSHSRGLESPLMPLLRPWSFGETPPLPVADPDIYESARPYPEKLVEYSVVRQAGVPLLELDIFSFQYRGETRELIEHRHLEVEIRLRTATGQLTPHAPNAVAQALYPNLMGEPPPEAAPVRTEVRRTPAVHSLLECEPADYVLIAPSAWTHALDYYITTKNAEGIETRAFALEDINDTYASGSTVTNMHLFIREAFTNWNISYVLLVGHTDYVPTKFLSTNVLVPREHDNFFALLDGESDRYPDVFLGRLPAHSAEEVERISRQWADYDATGWGRTELDILGYELEVYRAPSFKDYNWSYMDMWGTNVGYGITSNDVIHALNSGPALVNWVGHGSDTGWQLQVGEHSYVFREHEALALTNQTPRLPFINAIFSCYTAVFSRSNNIANSFIRAPEGGVIGYAGANNEVKLAPYEQRYSNIFFYNSLLSQFRTEASIHFAAAFQFAVQGNNTRLQLFNLLGDPTARMNLLPLPPDTTPPIVQSITVPQPLYVNYGFRLEAQVTDDDCVGLVFLEFEHESGEVTYADEFVVSQQTNFSRNIPDYITSATGAYHGKIIAYDVSSNRVEEPFSFEVSPDNEVPVIESISITPNPAARHGMVNMDIVVTDNLDPAPYIWGVMTFPDASVVTQSRDNLSSFIDTGQTGQYDIVIHAKDRSGNEAIPVTTNLWIMEDVTPPVIHDIWLAPADNYHSSGIWRSSCVTNPGTTIWPHMLVTEDLTPTHMLTAWTEVRLPDGSLVERYLNPDFEIPGYPAIYKGEFWQTTQTGTYQFVFFAEDSTGNRATRGPLWFFVTEGQLPPPVVHQTRPLGGDDFLLDCIAPAGTRPWLGKRPCLMQGGWQTVMSNEYSYTFSNGVLRIVITADPSRDRWYYKIMQLTPE